MVSSWSDLNFFFFYAISSKLVCVLLALNLKYTFRQFNRHHANASRLTEIDSYNQLVNQKNIN